MFGPEYQKINSVFKRDEKGRFLVWQWSTPEFEYLADTPWRWTEKVDGTNIRLHWDGNKMTVGGRTDNAQVSTKLMAVLADLGGAGSSKWEGMFPGCDNVTVYGEGYGAGIQSGGMYRPHQDLVVFDVRVNDWWLKEGDVAEVAGKLGLGVVPPVAVTSPRDMVEIVRGADLKSDWPNARIEGVVGRPTVSLFDRRGERIITKIKIKDFVPGRFIE